MIGFIFNHDVFESPYNQTASKKGFTKLEAYIKTLDLHPFYTFGGKRIDWDFPDMRDDYVIVQHTSDLSVEQKQQIAEYVKEILTVKKTVYKQAVPEVFIVFEKKAKEDCFAF